jgi:hypothetical protein
MWGSARVWEERPAREEAALLSEVFVQTSLKKETVGPQDASPPESPERDWVPASSLPAFMQRFGSGPLCRLPGPLKRYGRELHLGQRRGDGALALSPKLRKSLGLLAVAAEDLSESVLARLPSATGGGVPVGLLPRGEQLFVQLDY